LLVASASMTAFSCSYMSGGNKVKIYVEKSKEKQIQCRNCYPKIGFNIAK